MVVEDVERIEKKMRIDLLLEPLVVELRPMLLPALGTQLELRLDDVGHELDHGVDHDVDQQNDGVEPEERPLGEHGAVAPGQPEIDGRREQEDESEREERRTDQPQSAAPQHPGPDVDEDEVAAKHGQQSQRIAQQTVELVMHALLLEVGRIEESGVEDAEEENGRDDAHDLPGGRRPVHAAAGLRTARPGEKKREPPDPFGDGHGGDDGGENAVVDDPADGQRPVDAEEVGNEDADERQGGDELGAQIAADRDDQDHRERQHGERHVVHVVEDTAHRNDGGVGRGEEVDEERRTDRKAFHGVGDAKSNLKVTIFVFPSKFTVRKIAALPHEALRRAARDDGTQIKFPIYIF